MTTYHDFEFSDAHTPRLRISLKEVPGGSTPVETPFQHFELFSLTSNPPMGYRKSSQVAFLFL
jgi:hypothetical protein